MLAIGAAWKLRDIYCLHGNGQDGGLRLSRLNTRELHRRVWLHQSESGSGYSSAKLSRMSQWCMAGHFQADGLVGRLAYQVGAI